MSKANESQPPNPTAATNKLSRAILAADLLVNAKGDFSGAAKMLDAALAHDEPDVTAVQRVQALVLRAEAAANMDEPVLAKRLITEVRQIALSASERDALASELQTVSELDQMLE